MEHGLDDGPKVRQAGRDRGPLVELLGVFLAVCAADLFLSLMGYGVSGSSITVPLLVADMIMRIGWCILLPLLLTRRQAFDWKLPKSGSDWGKEFGWGFLLFLAMVGLSIVIGYIVTLLNIGGSPTHWEQPMKNHAIVATLLLFLPVVGLHEELLFRVYFQTRLTQVLRGSRVLPVVIGALLFAFMHGYPLDGTLMMIAIGGVLGTSYQANGKIPRLVVAHVLWDVAVTLLGLL